MVFFFGGGGGRWGTNHTVLIAVDNLLENPPKLYASHFKFL